MTMVKGRYKKRVMDEDRTRQAQMWWTFGVGLVLAVMALFQSTPRVEARTERGPAQLSAPRDTAALPAKAYRFKH
jgi:hypothetical protein